jgi:hypothetical protein
MAAALPLVLGFAVVATALVMETHETVAYYWSDFRLAIPDEANWSIAQEMSKIILDFEDGPAYVKTWSHWYDGRALKEYLDSNGKRWDGETPQMSVDSPPLRDYSGKMLVILHPEDVQTLDMLKSHFERWIVKTQSYPVSKAPIIIEFYGAR